MVVRLAHLTKFLTYYMPRVRWLQHLILTVGQNSKAHIIVC